jgi:hypothetical protein
MEKRKIGIVTTWQLPDNYGSQLQCYALQQVLRQLGYDPFLIKYDRAKISKTRMIFHWLSVLFTLQLSRVIKSVAQRTTNFKTKTIDRGFDRFMEIHIKSTEMIYSLAELKNNPPQADYYVCGSDNIWMNYDKGYFLEWGNISIPRIAYAPSFARESISKNFRNKLSRSLKRFAVVTVREESGVEICRQAGHKNVLVVPDPTLLLTQQDYFQLYPSVDKNKYVSEKYLLFYLLSEKTDIDFDAIISFAKQRGVKLICVQANGNYRTMSEEFVTVYPTLSEWLFLMANAEYVLTNSFHGTVFSIIFNKKFGFYPQTPRNDNADPNIRMHDFLHSLKLTDHLITGDLKILDDFIDYEQVNMTLNTQRETVKNYFKEWFQL